MAAHAFSRRMIDELALIGTRKAHEPGDVASWHEAAHPGRPLSGRCREENGHAADTPRMPMSL